MADVIAYEIVQQVLVEQPTAVVRGRLTVPDLVQWIGPGFGQVMRAVTVAGRRPVGPPFARYARVDAEPATFDVEAGFPVDAPLVGPSGGVEASALPAGPAVVTVHVGPYEAMAGAYEALERWLVEHDAAAAGAPWEVYLSEPAGDPATWRTQVVQPYRTKG